MVKRTIKEITPKPNDGYEYRSITSSGPVSVYRENLSDEICENLHLNHIINDYEKDGYEVIYAERQYKEKQVTANLLMRRGK